MSKNYSIHNNVQLRKGGRTIAKISEQEFASKAKNFILSSCKDNSWIIDKVQSTDNSKRIINYLPSAIRNIVYNDKKANNIITKDFKGIKPDWENYDIVGGLRTINGAPYIIIEVGGDWECPLAVFVYYDGSQFRCYIPKKGNAYRDDLKICFGNHDAYHGEIYSNPKKKILSDDEYAFRQLCKEGILDKEKDIDKKSGLGRNISINIKYCIEDFSERVDVKGLKESYNDIDRIMNESIKKHLDILNEDF